MSSEAAASPSSIALLSQIPPEVRATFTTAQIAALALATRTSAARHAIDYRVSVPLLFGHRFYVVVLAGHERRGLARLAAEGQIRTGRILLFACVAAALLGVGTTAARYVAEKLSSVAIAIGDAPRNPFIFIRLDREAAPED